MSFANIAELFLYYQSNRYKSIVICGGEPIYWLKGEDFPKGVFPHLVAVKTTIFQESHSMIQFSGTLKLGIYLFLKLRFKIFLDW